MQGLELEIDAQPSFNDIQQLKDNLGNHAQETLADPGFHPIAVFGRNDNGRLIGGVTGTINWHWLSISILWVRSEQRGHGLGRRLMNAIEAYAKTQGCTHAHVNTLGF